jgi:hypothetical protein
VETLQESKRDWSELPVEFLTGIDDAAKLPVVLSSSEHKLQAFE